MPMTPHKGESQSDFMARCVPETIGTGDSKRPQDQAVAICLNYWRKEHGGEKPSKQFGQDSPAMIPDPGQTYSEFIDECVDETGDFEGCQFAWAEFERAANGIRHKTHAAQVSGMEFILSDATPDRFGDIIMADGWELSNYRKNPIALFNHNPNFIVGKWENLRVENGALRGRLKMAPAGTSERIDEIRKLIDADILRAVSVGFTPIERRSRSTKNGEEKGEIYLKSELVETSLVAVPANPNALAIVKALNISAETRDLVFAKHGKKDDGVKQRGNGEYARTQRITKGTTMSPIAQRITDTQTRIVKLQDQLDTHLKSIDDENPSDDSLAITNDLTGKIEAQQRSLEALKRAESHIIESVKTEAPLPAVVRQNAVTQFSNGGASALEVSNRQPFAIPAQKLKAIDYFWRSVAIAFKHHGLRAQRSMNDILVESYGEDVNTKMVMDIVTRAASAPAMTTVSGWADTLVNKIIGDLIDALYPVSILPRLAGLGGSYTFGVNGQITLPARTVGNIGGGFIAQGAPIPVKQGAFTPVVMTPKKLGVITTLTREMAIHSTPALEGILRNGMLEDTGTAIDVVLMDNNAATAVRPQGIQNMAGAALGPTAAGGIGALIGDLKLLVNKVITTTAGNIRKPVWIINPSDVLAMSLTQAAAGGMLPFRDELAQGTLLGYPVLQTTTATNDTMYLVDAADFATSQGAPRFDISDSAVLHMEDTSPQQLASVATPNTVAAPMRSLYQTDSMAIRLIWDLDWVWKRQAVGAWITGMTWN